MVTVGILLTHVFIATVVLREYIFTPLVADVAFVFLG